MAFIDILGFRELVARAFRGPGEEGDALSTALEFIGRTAEKQNLDQVRPTFQATAFSDSVVISDEADAEGTSAVLDVASRFAAEFLWRGFACRGGVAIGDLVHQKHLLLGPGMITAYELETQAAVYPRIVLAESVNLSTFEKLARWKVLRDQDGFRFLDLFYRIRHTKTHGSPQGRNLSRVRERILNRMHEAERGDREAVTAKWRWLAARFNSDASSATAGDPIPVP